MQLGAQNDGEHNPPPPLVIPEVLFSRTQRYIVAKSSARASGTTLARSRRLDDEENNSQHDFSLDNASSGRAGIELRRASSPLSVDATLRSRAVPRERFLDRLCSICLVDLEDVDLSKELACTHFYHAHWYATSTTRLVFFPLACILLRAHLYHNSSSHVSLLAQPGLVVGSEFDLPAVQSRCCTTAAAIVL